MEYLDVLRRIFDEDMRLLDVNFFKTQTYREYLQQEGTELHTHYSFEFTRKDSEIWLLPWHRETPFLKPDPGTISKKPRVPPFEEVHTEIHMILEEELEQHIRYDQIQINEIASSVFVNINAWIAFDTMSDQTLCYYYYYKVMADIRPRLTRKLNALFFDDQKTEQERSDQIRKYQYALEYYLQELEKRFGKSDQRFNLKAIGIRKSREDSLKAIYLALEEIMLFIERYFSEVIDRKRNLPYLQRRSFINCYYSDAENLAVLFKKQKLPLAIEKAVCKPLQSIMDDHFKAFTYLDRQYYITFIELFTRLLKKSNKPHHDAIYKLLIALDFNTHTVYKALEEQLLVEMNQFEKHIEKKSFLYKRMVHIKRIVVTAPYRYNREFPSLKTSLLEMILSTVDLIDQQMELEKYQQEKVPDTGICRSKSVDGKVKKNRLNMSVHEISLLARLFFETGVVPLEHGKQQYFNFLSRIYKSKESDMISEHSIKNSFYSPPEEVYEPTEDLLIRMIGKLHKLRDARDLVKNG